MFGVTRARLVVLLASGIMALVAISAASSSVDLPLYLEPIRVGSFYDYFIGADVARLGGDRYFLLLQGGFHLPGQGSFGLPLDAEGRLRYPTPVPGDRSCTTSISYRSLPLGGDALVPGPISGRTYIVRAAPSRTMTGSPSRPAVSWGRAEPPPSPAPATWGLWSGRIRCMSGGPW
jgi:hypothetical protein